MTKTEAVHLNVQLETSNVEADITEITKQLEGVGSIAVKIGRTIRNAFAPDIGNLSDARKTFQDMAGDLDTVANKMEELVALMTPSEESFFDGVLSGADGFNTLVDSMGNVENLSDSIGKGIKKAKENREGFNIFKALTPDSYDLAGKLGKSILGGSEDGKVSKLSAAISDAGQKMREFGSAVSATFSNFGTTIAQLAASTGTWIANTAAKVSNTAAQWAQIAATTAWQAICTAATAVTTAFGAAMTFLTSPIGLVVIAVVALIAIIALLIANWDTVKATVLTVWENIKAALATAAEWFDTNVLQPIVGFFTSAMEWISTKVQEGFAFVQGIFAGVNAFLQGVFAKDWTEQFGAFGNVLNAFFANVENIWNAVKSIFSGIVDFVKNVFAGDWGAAWDSIVGVFKGIWDLLVSIVKAPINVIIGWINGLVQGVVDGINLVIGALNGISFDIPDWVPVVGGQTFGFNLQLLKAPQIPLLAKGAVLPANKPFLAVVGDQRHGTNVEAPLATIQEAVALVMEDQFNGMMAGFEASVAVQRQILQAVLGIEVGDTTIGQAAARYNRRMAVIKGGM